MKIIILTTIALFIIFPISGQNQKKCDKVFDVVDKMPEYDKNEAGILQYVYEELMPILEKFTNKDNTDEDGNLITKLHIILTINKKGKIIDVIISKPNLSEKCKTELKNKLLTMKGWKPAQLKGKNVCAHYYIPINCIKWQ